MTRPMANIGFRRFAILTLGFTLAVILWGAYVRASGSGAGCGSHWPTCNGQVIPRIESMKTLVEVTHRATSGLCLILIVIQGVWARRAFPRGHGARRAAAWGMVFIFTEALVGGGLVLFEMVASNKSAARGAWVAAHLLNTNVLLYFLGQVVWRSRATAFPPVVESARLVRALGVSLGALLLVAMSGAITALGDTLFPVQTLAQGIAQDLSATSHLFVRLRVWHPVLAVATGLVLLGIVAPLAARTRDDRVRKAATFTAVCVLGQVGLGIANLVLLAPIALQLLHLLGADLIWLGVVWLREILRSA